MKAIEYRSKVKSRSDVLELIPIADPHDGTKNFDEKKLIETVNYIKAEPYRRWIGIGDYCEFINYTDKRFDPSNIPVHFLSQLDNLHIAQANHIYEILSPIADKCIGLIEGNHDDAIRLKYHVNIVDYLAVRLNTVNLSYTAMVRWTITRPSGSSKNVVIYATHGFGGSASEGAPINRLIKQSESFEADIYLMGHVHKKVAIDRDKLILNSCGEPRLKEKKQLFGICGTFYKTYEVDSRSYGEKGGYAPTPTGTLKIRIEPFRIIKEGGKTIDQPPHLHVYSSI